MEIREESGDIKEKKMGYYLAEQKIFEDVSKETGTNGKRHPLTYILEAADDLAYKTADIEDAFVKGYISYPMLESELKKLKNSVRTRRLTDWKNCRVCIRAGKKRVCGIRRVMRSKTGSSGFRDF